MDSDLLGSFGRMCPDCSLAHLQRLVSLARTSSRSRLHWMGSGILERGQLLMLDTSEWPSDADAFSECSLALILEPDAPQKYSLSPRACRGILRRAEKRGRALPERLEAALRAGAGETTPTAPNSSLAPLTP